ncbi:autophagy-related protein 22-like protein [Zychaea mexicana]|uniref:autophagy-related protein 22-like protein n=1 Tax=Zychaea mexicana TaxID=64656 RepID=UPI0022FDD205|nr:autophagy-related protein 22-like protein [Zychaea mexicana]KAI9490486.1 autophagy-related protein 22-like protein [Zychaea mexicana]
MFSAVSYFDWNRILTLNREYPTDEEVKSSGETIPDWDKVPQTTAWERWAYYFYYNGNNGINYYSYVPNVIQYLTAENGWDPSQGPQGAVPCGESTSCEVRLGGSTISVDSLILLYNGLNALIQALVLTTIGSLADYGNNSHNILLVVTIISCAAQIAFLAFNEDASQYWGVPFLVALVFQVSYGASLVFYWAIFPSLAVNDPKVRAAKRNPHVSQEEYAVIESFCRNHISTISTAWSNIGFFVISTLNIIIGNALAIRYNVSWDEVPQYGNSIYSAMCGAYWLLCGIPWFIVQKKRPGPPLPADANYFTYGWKTLGLAIKEYRRLPQTFLFLGAYFLLNDAVSSMNSVTQVLTVSLTNYDGLMQTYLSLVQAVCSIIGCFLFLHVQKRFHLSTKTMLQISTGFTAIMPIWCCIGIWSPTIGFRTQAELWIYNAWFGIFTAPFYAYSQTLMSELVPIGKENMFFSLFGIVSKVAQFFGPALIGGVVAATKNTRIGFILCAVANVLPLIVVAAINMERAEVRVKVYEEQERRKSETSVDELLQHGHHHNSDDDDDDDQVVHEEVFYLPQQQPSLSSVTPSSNHPKSSDGYQGGYGF